MSELIDNVFNQIADPAKQIDLPNDRGIFRKGLFALIFFIIPGFMISLILSKMCFDDSKIALDAYKANPNLYRKSSIAKIRKGRTFVYIGLGIFVFEAIAFMGYLSR